MPEIVPELAASWERSPDGLTFTFDITPGVTWQNVAPLNGRPFVAEDARYALERYSTDGVHKAYYLNVAGFEAVDDATFKINMAKPTADFLNPLASNKQTVFPRELVDDGSIGTVAVGTGPMILTGADPAANVTFDKNPDYWEREVLLDGFEFRVMPDHVARLAQFRVGNIDYAYGLVSTVRDLNEVLQTNPDVQVNFIPITYNSISLGMNHTLEKYQDVRVRRALSLAIDRQEILDIVYDGIGKALNIIPWPFLFEEEATIESGLVGNWLRYDPDEAVKLLQAAGAEGLTVENSYYAYTSGIEQTTEVAQAQLQRAGITMSGGKVDYTEFNSQWVPQKLPDISTSAWSTSGYDADNWFHGQVHSESPGNRWRMNDPEIDVWAEAQQLELDPAARKDLWQKIWDQDLDQVYRPTLPWGFSLEVYQPWMRGIRFTGTAPGDNNSYYTWGGVGLAAAFDSVTGRPSCVSGLRLRCALGRAARDDDDDAAVAMPRFQNRLRRKTIDEGDSPWLQTWNSASPAGGHTRRRTLPRRPARRRRTAAVASSSTGRHEQLERAARRPAGATTPTTRRMRQMRRRRRRSASWSATRR